MVDDDVPEAFRRAAFALKVGQVSSPIQTGQWYHLLRVEEKIPAESPAMPDVRADLERRVHERFVDGRMRDIYARLAAKASVQIRDPILKEAYDRRNPSPK